MAANARVRALAREACERLLRPGDTLPASSGKTCNDALELKRGQRGDDLRRSEPGPRDERIDVGRIVTECADDRARVGIGGFALFVRFDALLCGRRPQRELFEDVLRSLDELRSFADQPMAALRKRR